MLLPKNKRKEVERWINNIADIKKETENSISKLQFISVATRQLPDANTTIAEEEQKEQYYFKILK